MPALRADQIKVGRSVRFHSAVRFGAFTVPAGAIGSIGAEEWDDGHVSVNVRVDGVLRKVSVTRFHLTKVRPGPVEVGTIVLHALNRTTGTTITVERTGPGSWIEQEPGWMTICMNHSTCVNHSTNAAAKSFARVPWEWCQPCREIAESRAPKVTTGKVR